MPAKEALAALPLDLIGFAEEITEYDDKLNFYIPVTFDCDAVFGTDVCSPDNDDYLIIYVDYDMFTGKGIAEYAKEVMGEPERPVSLKTAAKESREASAALAGNDAHEDIGQDAR